MPYATRQDVIDLRGREILLEVADLDGDGALSADEEARVDRGLDYASAKIDSYLRARYDLPLPSTPPELVEICIDIALFRLEPNPALATERREKDYEMAISWLKDVARGNVAIAAGSDADPAPQVGGEVFLDGPDRAWTREKTKGM